MKGKGRGPLYRHWEASTPHSAVKVWIATACRYLPLERLSANLANTDSPLSPHLKKARNRKMGEWELVPAEERVALETDIWFGSCKPEISPRDLEQWHPAFSPTAPHVSPQI